MGTAPAQSIAVRADRIRPGLYVRALDRPWIETPFFFQGFRVVSDAEVEALQRYCRYVYVDLGRSDPAAAEQVLAAGGRKGVQAAALEGGPVESSGDPDAELAAGDPSIGHSPLFADATHPDRDAFRERVREAGAVREGARRAASDALARAASGQPIDVPGAGRAVSRLARLVADEPTASLWLTRMQAYGDYTATHAVNACVLALAFGQYLGIEDAQLERLGLGVLLMDIGRTRLPRGLLDKPRGLSATEYAFVKRHVEYGVRLLRGSDIARESLDIVRMHHERIRGHGYPRGVAGDRIPWTALIAGLVDSYDAMQRPRPHRDAYKPDAALKVLYEQAEATFGKDLVESFIRYLGAYPVGTLVELDNRAVGVVVGNRPGAGLWPTVLLVRNADREPFEKRLLVNLAAASRDPGAGGATGVRRTLTQREARVPVGKLVAAEFGAARAG